MRGKERGELSADESFPHFLLHSLQCEWLALPLGEELWTDRGWKGVKMEEKGGGGGKEVGEGGGEVSWSVGRAGGVPRGGVSM